MDGSPCPGPPRHHQQNYQSSESGVKESGIDRESSPRSLRAPNFLPVGACERGPQPSNPPVRGEGEKGGGGPRSRVQESKRSRLAKDSLKRTAVKRQGDETQGQQPPQGWYPHNFSFPHRCPENPKPLDGTGTKAADHGLRCGSQAEQGGPRKCQFTISPAT
ncbi:hypothetical protein GH733_009500 [Mirounga leonina]|nr:hypothetical protein GH733_009500 [Mirounga leonina]